MHNNYIAYRSRENMVDLAIKKSLCDGEQNFENDFAHQDFSLK